MSITVRDATPEDLPAVAAIYTHYTLRTTTTVNTEVRPPREWRERFEQHVQQGPYHLLVAVEDGEAEGAGAAAGGGAVVGFVETQRFRPKPAYDRSLELSVYVSPDLQARGVGSALYRELFARIEGGGVFHRAFSIIALPNDASVAFHERHGFVHRGTLSEAGFKFGQYLDIAYYERPV